MRRILCGIMLIAAVAAAEPSFNTRLEQGHAALSAGDAERAIGVYRDLQTDDPESDVLYYSIGRAQYEQGVQNAELGAPEDAIAAFEEAANTFEMVATASDPELRKRAAYNHANSIAQIAEQSAAAQQHDETVAAFEQSVGEYEEFLRKHPDHTEARNNLDHMRFLLKSMLQNPPPPQEQQQDQEGEDGEGEDGDKSEEGQKKEGGDQQDGEDGEQEQQQGDESQEEQDGDDEQDGGEQESEQQEGAQSEEQGEGEPTGEGEEIDRQNVEALLESLEDIDEREQRETKNVRRDIQMRKDWW